MLLFTRAIRLFSLLAMMFVLAACGGGGTGGPLDNNTGGGPTEPDPGTITTDSGLGLLIELYAEDVDLSNLAGSTIVDTVSQVDPGVLVIRVTNTITGNPVANAIVEVSTTVGILIPSNGQVLTNSSGLATVTVTSDGTDDGAGTLIATLNDATAERNFQIGTVPLRLGRDLNDNYTDVTNNLIFDPGNITVGNPTIASNGSTSLFVVVADDNGDVYTPPLVINFSSSCALSNDAFLDTGVTTSNGVAIATYEADGCEGADDITATIDGVSGVSAIGTVSVTASVANSIKFVSAAPESLAIKGTGGSGRQENSTLTFQVVDENGSPKEGIPVSFSLSTTTGGIALAGDADGDGDMDSSGASDERKPTNTSGNVSVTVNAGRAVTPVRVTASFVSASGATISIVSDALTISTGLPDQDSFSLVSAIRNPGGWNADNIITSLTINAGDAVNNPVPDGTVINFITEYGRVTNPDLSPPSASCQTINGSCTVEWNSQEPRTPASPLTGEVLNLNDPDHICPLAGVLTNVPCLVALEDQNDTDYPGQIYGGRSTILAYALGEESFIDANGNGLYDYVDETGGVDGVYDPGIDRLESFTDMPEAYIDNNEDGAFGSTDTIGGCESGAGDADATATECFGHTGWEEGGAEEEHIDRFVNGQYDGDEGAPAAGDIVNRTGFGNGVYNGSLCSAELEALSPPRCSTDLINVRSQTAIVVGGADAYIAFYDGDELTSNYLANANADVDVSVATGTGGVAVNRSIYISDLFNGRLPFGTAVVVTSTNCLVEGDIAEGEFGNSSAKGIRAPLNITLDEDESAARTTGIVTVTVTPPDGVGGGIQSRSFSCTDTD